MAPKKSPKKEPEPQRAVKPLGKNVVVSCGQHLDHSMTTMEETRFKKKHFALTKRLSNELHFSFNEMECLFIIYEKFRLANGKHSRGMTVTQFFDFIHNSLDMTDIDITKYAVSHLHISSANTSRKIFEMEAWARALSVLLRGTLEEKVKYAFKVYDNMRVGMITKDTMQRLMEKAVIGEDNPEEAVKDLLEIVTKKMDIDRDGKITIGDFQKCVQQEPLLLEAFGECLPSRYAVQSFLTSFTHQTGRT